MSRVISIGPRLHSLSVPDDYALGHVCARVFQEALHSRLRAMAPVDILISGTAFDNPC